MSFQVQLTNAGAALIAAATGPIVITRIDLGSSSNYVPSPTATGVQGTVVWTGVPSAPIATSPQVVRYSSYLDYDLGPFDYGEFAMFTSDGTCFAVGSSNTLVHKIPVTPTSWGNSIRNDIYLTVVGTNYDMFMDYAESNNQFRMAVLGSVDQLPPAQMAVPNVYVIAGITSDQSSYMAYTDRAGLWDFDCYQFINQATVPIKAFDSLSVTIDVSNYEQEMFPAYFGEIVLQFMTGSIYSTCRYVKTAVTSGTNVTLGFDTPMMKTPNVGDFVRIYGRNILSTTIKNLPIATHTTIGGVIIGNTLTVDGTGLIDVNPASYPVKSVNGMTGNVIVTANDVPGLATVAKTGSYTDLLNTPAPYQLPVAAASVLGGVKVPSGQFITVAADGSLGTSYTPVKTVNGAAPDASGNITITVGAIGLVNPQQIAAASDLNGYTTTGLYFVLDADSASLVNAPGSSVGRPGAILEVEPFTITASGGDVIQRWQSASAQFFRRYTQSNNTWSTWVQTSTTAQQPIATTTTLGTIIVGSGLNVTAAGVLSTAIISVNGQTSGDILITPASIGAIGDAPGTPTGHVWGRQLGAWVDLTTYVFDAGTF